MMQRAKKSNSLIFLVALMFVALFFTPAFSWLVTGFTTNISNECLNMYAASGFYEIAEKLIRENLYLNKFYPIKSYFAVSTCMEKGGLLEHLIKPFNRQNFNSLIHLFINYHY